ncbi:MAG TPA: nucleotide sugar dehydrogenase, partial [Candidatus Moranbacteria bacterium]|nr:nucleotide sugar dehydrogenase [Candidatus Moranbacteria bacterium]
MSKKQKVSVIGLGYVGLPLALRAAERGYEVVGYDPDRDKVASINEGQSPFEDDFVSELLPKYPIKASEKEDVLRESDIVLICVPTPVDEMQNPIYDYVVSAAAAAARNLRSGALVVLESTVNPGVSEEIVLPIFEKKGLQVGRDFFLAHCPERINPGDPKWNVGNIPRVVGAFTEEGASRAVKFYRSIVDAPIKAMKSIREAEAVKVVENSFRDINIAFVNELAQSFDRLGIDIVDVIDGAATKPFAFLPHYPSCGVGGHCIPVDPYYLIEYAKKAGFDHRFMRAAR